MSGNAVIYFEPEGYSITGPRLMGRNAAGFGFLNGFFRHAVVERFVGASTNPAHEEPFRAMAAKAGTIRPISMVHTNNTQALTETGCLFMPGPGLSEPAFQRSLVHPAAYSLCGITHTLLTDRVMDSLCATLTDPIEAWDAIICTSTVARDTIETVLKAESERLSKRLGATKFPKPQLPVIPLGVDCEKFHSTPERKAKARKRLGFGEDEIIILFVGRLSFHAKAHPIAMYQAIAAASEGRPVRLVEYGKFFNDAIRFSFDELWTMLAPGLSRTVLDGSSFAAGDDAWAAADIFCSLSDNFQETFGLTPVEAMAAGLPVLVSDWNGYRDTVRHGLDGFRVPTFMPSGGFGQDIVTRYARGDDNYDIYCGTTSMAVAIDLRETITALRALVHDNALRKSMGETARAHALAMFDWSHIIRRYQELWRDLEDRRRHAADQSKPYAPAPRRLDPFEAFKTYATHPITHQTKFFRRSDLTRNDLLKILDLKSMTLAGRLLPSRDHLLRILDQFNPDYPLALDDLDQADDLTDRDRIACLAFGLKIGALTFSAPQ